MLILRLLYKRLLYGQKCSFLNVVTYSVEPLEGLNIPPHPYLYNWQNSKHQAIGLRPRSILQT